MLRHAFLSNVSSQSKILCHFFSLVDGQFSYDILLSVIGSIEDGAFPSYYEQ